MRIIEKIILLRSLNYVRVNHGYWWRFNVFLPATLTASVFILLFIFSGDLDFFGRDGFLRQFSQILSILAPFYIAALAAISTFPANKSFDEPMKMTRPPIISVFERGVWRERSVTLRHFLSLLFGYCSVMSFSLFFFSLLGPLIGPGLFKAIGGEHFISWVLLLCFLFAIFHMIIATLLGMYYLSDKMHRSFD